MRALGDILDLLPVAYMVRIDTVDQQVYQMTGPGQDVPGNNIRLVARVEPPKFDS